MYTYKYSYLNFFVSNNLKIFFDIFLNNIKIMQDIKNSNDGLVGSNLLLLKNILNIMNIETLVIYKRLAPENWEKYSVQIVKI
jgi:hypothetical protein